MLLYFLLGAAAGALLSSITALVVSQYYMKKNEYEYEIETLQKQIKLLKDDKTTNIDKYRNSRGLFSHRAVNEELD